MDYVLSDHARKRILKRKIRAEWIEATSADPTGIEPDDDDSTLAHALPKGSAFQGACQGQPLIFSLPDINTPKHDIDLAHERLKRLKEMLR